MVTETSGSPVYIGGGDGMGLGGGGWIWAILILALFGFGGFGGFGMNGLGAMAMSGENAPASVGFVQNQSNYSNLLDQNRDILNAISNGTAQSVAATNQVYHDLANTVQDKYGELQRDIASVQVAQANALANQNECCLNTRMAIAEGTAATNANIAQSRYENAMNSASNTQKILDAITGNRMADMQNQINQLQLQNAMAGVLKFPNAWTFGAGSFPCGNNPPPVPPFWTYTA